MEFRRASVLVDAHVAGAISEIESGYRFAYDPSYLSRPDALPVSLTLPLRNEPFTDKVLFPFFDGLIPEGWMLALAEKTWKLDRCDRMGLLLACCRECIGNVSVIAENGGP